MGKYDADERRIKRLEAQGRREAEARDAKKAEADAEYEAEVQRRIALSDSTNSIYDDRDFAIVAVEDSKLLQYQGSESRKNAAKKEALKRVAEDRKRRKVNTESYIGEHVDEIIEKVESAYLADRKNNTRRKLTELAELNEEHTERVLAREMQEDTALDVIRGQKANGH